LKSNKGKDQAVSDSNVARLPQQALPTTTSAIDFPTMLMLCIEKGIDPQTIVQMHNEQQDRAQKAALNLAMADAYGDVLPVLKDGHNKHLGNRYATVPQIMDMLHPILRKYGIGVSFDAGMMPGEPPVTEGCIRVRIVVSYGGYSDRYSYLDEPISRGGVRGGVTQMTDQQAITSATTYAQRTLLKLKFNITAVEDDDDGETSRSSPPRDPRDDPRGFDPAGKSSSATRPPPDPLEEPNGTKWLANLKRLVEGAASLDALVTIGGHRTVLKAKSDAPLLIRRQVDDLFREAHERLAPAGGDTATDPAGDGGNAPGQTWDDPIEALLAEVEAMDADGLALLKDSASWRVKTRDLFPPDQDRIAEAIEARKAALRGGTGE
jgi:hypothetical protein